MNARALFLILFCLLPGALRAQGLSDLSSDASGFALPTPDPVFRFPADHGAHPDFRIEWWYVTANLTDTNGTAYGAQWTLFRTGLRPEDAPGWASPQVWFAHAALTTPQEHLTAETFARGGIGQAGVTADPFDAWINDWALRADPPSGTLDALRMTATGDGFSYDLGLTADRPVVPQGAAGYSLKSPRGQASYYYSQPFLRVAGTLTLPSGPVPVTGQAWLDREWSSQPLAPSQAGWDWFALHLESGEKVMIYRLRDSDGPDFTPGTWIDADGTPHPAPDGEITLTPLATAHVAGHTLPVRWKVRWPARGLDVTATALNTQSWTGTTVSYWEGPIRFSGSHSGVGYLEMTGYP